MRGVLLCLWVTVSLLTLASAPGPIAFEEIAAGSGVQFIADSSPTPNKNQPETMVAGVAVFDYDNDGHYDIYFVNGAAIPSLRKDSSRFWNRLFRNNGNGTFTDTTESAGAAGAGYGMGVAAGDFDNDGWTDLYLANVTANQLLRNNGNGTFTDITNKAGLRGPFSGGKKMWSISAGWFDYNNDGFLDLFVSNYCKWEVNKDPFCGPNPSTRAYCHPKYYAALPNTLYRNNGNGTFTDVSAAAGISEFEGKGMGVVFADYDHDGFMDVFVANDNAPNMLFRNIGGKRFDEVALRAGVAYPEAGSFISGMGADFKDIDNDGWDDLWHTAIEGESFPLFRNRGRTGDFLEITGASGLGHVTREMSGWSNAIADFDNDGWKDLIAVRGNVQDNIAAVSYRKYEEPVTVFRNLANRKFLDVSRDAGAALQKADPHRGLALGDLDNDGRIDAVVTVLNGKAKLFRNTSPAGHWLSVKLTGTRSNRMGIGARLRIRTEDGAEQFNHGTTSTGYAASSDPRVHFGLGKANKVAEMEIRWPSGAVQVIRDIAADRILPVKEP